MTDASSSNRTDRERLGELGLADAGGPEEQERSDRAARVAHAGAVAAHGLGDGGHRVVLPDDARVQLVLEDGEALALGLGEALDRDAGGAADDGGDLGLVHDGASGAGPRGRLFEACLHVGDLVADARGLLVVLGADGRVLVGLEVGQARR